MPVHVPRQAPAVPHFNSRSRQELRAMAFQPVRRSRGTNYPCTESELRDATTLSDRPRRTVSAMQASQEVLAHNALGRNLSGAEYNAVCRLEDMILAVYANRINWGPDLIIKAFCDLDRVFFLGNLRGHVFVKWKSASSFPAPSRHRLYLGRTDYQGHGKARIILNADAIFGATQFSSFMETWRTLLHEMCHAYEFTQVASRNWESNIHGRHFGTKIRPVHRRATRAIHVSALNQGEVYNHYIVGNH